MTTFYPTPHGSGPESRAHIGRNPSTSLPPLCTTPSIVSVPHHVDVDVDVDVDAPSPPPFLPPSPFPLPFFPPPSTENRRRSTKYGRSSSIFVDPPLLLPPNHRRSKDFAATLLRHATCLVFLIDVDSSTKRRLNRRSARLRSAPSGSGVFRSARPGVRTVSLHRARLPRRRRTVRPARSASAGSCRSASTSLPFFSSAPRNFRATWGAPPLVGLRCRSCCSAASGGRS